ncbi:hypothetical protein A4E84_02670 [Streptomyces qaidamensis]|uniref:Uncharacterized protein n=1 Tax=Streptomyces qaidamensis TaxID=1783515 RepID=A0A143BUL6_9ACTN|nr:hypothetical protein [Streptomyces qaidamensis]AMW08519.1 hypothetical protein A4E84_02670 [Streptomyces qaidamensis]
MDTAVPVISRMRDPIGADARLALDLALTIRHDGNGGVTDHVTARVNLTAWARAHPEVLPRTARNRSGHTDTPAVTADSARRGDREDTATGTARHRGRRPVMAALPGAPPTPRGSPPGASCGPPVRALFARAVRPGEPSSADAGRLMRWRETVRLLDEAAARTPAVLVLDWPEDTPAPPPSRSWTGPKPPGRPADARTRRRRPHHGPRATP